MDEHLAHESPEQRDIRENAVTLCHLTQHERVEVLEALDMLKGVASLRDAVGFFIQHHSAPNVALSVQEVFGQYIDRARYDRPEIAILTPDDVRRLLCAARDHAPELVAYLAIAVFAGVRPTELQRLTWESVNFDLRYIHIGGGVSKVRNERYVDMEDLLAKWLEPYRQTSGPITPQNTYVFNKLFNRARKAAGLKEGWTPDILRHTFASYHAAKHEQKDKTALMMGSSVKMLDRHYRRPLHRSHVKEFWSIFPQEDIPLS